MDYYAVLELTHDADAEAIRQAYRRLAKRYHPDVSKEQDAHRLFIRITEAYEILSDPIKRNRYDLTGSSPRPGTAAPHRQKGYERDVRNYQSRARERAERFSRMRYEQFDHAYFDTAMGYAGPKMLGCLGIGIVYVALIAIVLVTIETYALPEWTYGFPIALLLSMVPVSSWISTHFDLWHNERQRRRRSTEGH